MKLQVVSSGSLFLRATGRCGRIRSACVQLSEDSDEGASLRRLVDPELRYEWTGAQSYLYPGTARALPP